MVIVILVIVIVIAIMRVTWERAKRSRQRMFMSTREEQNVSGNGGEERV